MTGLEGIVRSANWILEIDEDREPGAETCSWALTINRPGFYVQVAVGRLSVLADLRELLTDSKTAYREVRLGDLLGGILSVDLDEGRLRFRAYDPRRTPGTGHPDLLEVYYPASEIEAFRNALLDLLEELNPADLRKNGGEKREGGRSHSAD